MKKFILIFVLCSAYAFSQLSGGFALTIVGGSAVQDSITAKVNKKDTVGTVAAYVTPTQNLLKQTASSLVFDTTAFTTTATRLARFYSGITPASVIVAIPRGLDAANGSESLPVAGDLLKVVCKADSIITLRAVGTTSGLKVTLVGRK